MPKKLTNNLSFEYILLPNERKKRIGFIMAEEVFFWAILFLSIPLVLEAGARAGHEFTLDDFIVFFVGYFPMSLMLIYYCICTNSKVGINDKGIFIKHTPHIIRFIAWKNMTMLTIQKVGVSRSSSINCIVLSIDQYPLPKKYTYLSYYFFRYKHLVLLRFSEERYKTIMGYLNKFTN